MGSMHAGRLVLICGAGLSMAPPSSLPSARRIAELCFDDYQLNVDPNLDLALRGNLEALAEHFADLHSLKSLFIERLVPWKEFERQPNSGHAAIADFLITRAAAAGLSGNFDKLIELSAWSYGADFQGALDGDEATVCAYSQSPLLKFHGCSHRDRAATVWAASQLSDPVIADRIGKSKIWMAANLRQKDLLVVGFWSDWDYLNQIIGGALAGLDPLSVTVVDLSAAEDLERKAPDLWAIAHAGHVQFTHVQESGADVLDDLRRAFSENYLRKILAAGRELLEAETGTQCDAGLLAVAGLDCEALYHWRRDAEGVPIGQPAVERRPKDGDLLGYFHLLLRHAGAAQDSMGYVYAGLRIRVVNGGGHDLNRLARRFAEPPAVPPANVFVAVGASDLGLPAHVLRSGTPGSVVRPGSVGTWWTLEKAREELRI